MPGHKPLDPFVMLTETNIVQFQSISRCLGYDMVAVSKKIQNEKNINQNIRTGNRKLYLVKGYLDKSVESYTKGFETDC